MAHALVHAALAAALVLGLWATGRAVAAILRAPIDALQLPGVAPVALGMIAWSAGLFALAALDLLFPAILRAGALGSAALGGALLARDSRRRWKAPVRSRSKRWPEVAGAACLAIAFAASFLLSLDPRVEWDAATYHLTLPRIFLEEGGFVRIPYFVYSTWPLATEMLYAVALALRDHVLAAGLHFACGALLAIAVVRVAGRSAGPAAGIFAGALLLADPSFRFELRTAYVDLAFALLFFLGWCAWEPAAGEPSSARRRARLALAGIFLGGAAGSKLVGGLGAAIIAALEIGRGVSRRRAPTERAGDLACLLLPALALALPWYARSWWLTGDPLHPALHAIFAGGGDEWSAELAALTAAHHRAYGMGRSPWDFLLLPLRLPAVADPDAALRFAGSLHPLWALLFPILAWGCFADRAVRAFALPALAWVACWFAGSQTVRLLLPAQPFLAAAAAIACARAAAAVAPRRPGAFAGLALALAAAVAAAAVHSAAPHTAALFALARGGERALLESGVPPHCRYVNAELPPDARILMLGDNRAFFCRRAFLADSLFQASQMNALLHTTRDAAGLSALLDRLGATHVLVAERDWGIEWPAHLRDALADPRRLRPVYRDPEFTLYATGREAPSPARGERRTAP